MSSADVVSRFPSIWSRRTTVMVAVVLSGMFCFGTQRASATAINVSSTCTLQEAVTSVERAIFNPTPPPAPEPGCTFVSDGQSGYTVAVPSGTTVITAEILIRATMTIAGAGTSATTLATTPAVAFRVEGSPLPNPTLTLRTLTLRKSVTTTSATSGVFVNGVPGPAHLALDRVRLANYTRDGIVLQGSPPTFKVDASVVNSTIEGNTLAGIVSSDGGVFVSGSTVTNNLGGGIRGTFTDASLRMEVVSSTISNNRGADGGGLYLSVLGGWETFDPQLLVVGSTLSGNQATGHGGGAFSAGAIARYERVVATNNVAAGDGGGVCGASDAEGLNSADVGIVDSSMTGNRATNGGGMALVMLGQRAFGNIDRSLFATNIATGDGGGVFSGDQFGGINNSTFSGNSAARGGGFFHGPFGGESHMTNCTIAGNSASTRGGGAHIERSNPLFRGNIVATNTAPTSPDILVNVDLPDFGFYNLIGDNAGATQSLPNGVNGNIAGNASSPVNPLLGPLQNLGGPTQVRPLLVGSRAIDAVPAEGGRRSAQPPAPAGERQRHGRLRAGRECERLDLRLRDDVQLDVAGAAVAGRHEEDAGIVRDGRGQQRLSPADERGADDAGVTARLHAAARRLRARQPAEPLLVRGSADVRELPLGGREQRLPRSGGADGQADERVLDAVVFGAHQRPHGARPEPPRLHAGDRRQHQRNARDAGARQPALRAVAGGNHGAARRLVGAAASGLICVLLPA